MHEGWLRLLTASVGGAAIVVVALLGLGFVSADVERQTDVQFVNMAVEILAEEPTLQKRPLREWAIELINNHSKKVQIGEKAKLVLLDTAWTLKAYDAASWEGYLSIPGLAPKLSWEVPVAPAEAPAQPSE
jgi:hypothetical protein